MSQGGLTGADYLVKVQFIGLDTASNYRGDSQLAYRGPLKGMMSITISRDWFSLVP